MVPVIEVLTAEVRLVRWSHLITTVAIIALLEVVGLVAISLAVVGRVRPVQI